MALRRSLFPLKEDGSSSRCRIMCPSSWRRVGWTPPTSRTASRSFLPLSLLRKRARVGAATSRRQRRRSPSDPGTVYDQLPESDSDADMSDGTRLARFPLLARARRPIAFAWRVERSPRFAEAPHHLSSLPRWQHPQRQDAWVETPTTWIRIHRLPPKQGF